VTGTDYDFVESARPAGDLAVRWIHGSPSSRHRTDPPIQAHAYDAATYILRESKDVSFEAPFLFLLFGNDRAILLDTGTTSDPDRFPLRETVDGLVEAWLARHPRPGFELVVAHSHSHSDHTGGDPQFRDRPSTRIVGLAPDEVQQFFGLTGPSDGPRPFDLGGRKLDVFPIPPPSRSTIAGPASC
jgi:hydroxyacylglutathione hydrolase